MTKLPDYLAVSREHLGCGTGVRVTVKSDMASVGAAMAADMLEEILTAAEKGRAATLIIPVGPVDGFVVLAEKLRSRNLSIAEVMLINMDEYLDENGEWLPVEHPLSFRGFMERSFYNILGPALSPKSENRVFPEPANPGELETLIASRGGVDACFGGIGINGHLAFNEPPEPGESVSNENFAQLPTRVLPLSRETRTINAVTVGGDVTLIPARAVTVGMKEILASRKLRLYCNRPWQSAVVRRTLHGPVTSACPASFMRLHPDAHLTVAEYVAAPPCVALR